MKCPLIVQISPMHSGSTVLVNAIMGSLFAGQAVLFRFNPFKVPCNLKLVKTHDNWKMTRMGSWNLMNKDRKITFISSSRASIHNTVVPVLPNHIVFNYEEIIKDRFCMVLNVKINGSVNGCIERLRGMNSVQEFISKSPFAYKHPYYDVHGSHKNRSISLNDIILG
jgi:hypothetical protein